MRELVDQYGRRVRKLRVSLTDICNLRCHYCMPEEAIFMPKSNYLTPFEYHQIIKELCDYGLEEIRITGGEPLMRSNFEDIIDAIAFLPLKKISLTTNAILLDRYFSFLKDYNINSINISLDSLNAENFKVITRRDHFHRTMRNIEKAVQLDFQVKINTVMMRNVNHHELFSFVELAKNLNVEVRFLEVMRIGEAIEKQNDQFISAREMRCILNEKFSLKRIQSAFDATANSYILDNGARVGFIASESEPFCGGCSRWRLSSDGVIRACLLKDDGLSIKNKSKEECSEIFQKLLGMKPSLRPKQVTHLMHQIGG